MLTKTVIRWLAAFSAAWWAFAFTATGLMLIFAPNGDQYPRLEGCYFTSDLIVHVACRGIWNGEFISGLLTLALYWTFESPILIPMMLAAPKKVFGIGFIILWLASLVLALSFLLRRMRELRQSSRLASSHKAHT